EGGAGGGGGVAAERAAGGAARPAAPAVGAGGVAGERRAPARPRERNRQRQRVFLVGPTAAVAAQRHREFAARQDHRAPPLRLEIAGQSCLRGGDLARLALDRRAEQDALVSGGVRRVFHGAEDLGGPCRQRERGGGEHRIARFRRLIGGGGGGPRPPPPQPHPA